MLTPFERFGLSQMVAPTPSNWRKMYDAMGQNAPTLLAFSPKLIGAYVTGSTANPQIVWTPEDRKLFPNAAFANIDQAGNGSPVYAATVMDVEPGAFPVDAIPDWTSKSTAPRPTVYCDRLDYSAARKVWTKDLWLAWPGASYAMVQEFAIQTLGHTDPHIVACQNLFTSSHDVSDVFDPTWPFAGAKDVISGTLTAHGTSEDSAFVPFPSGTFHQVQLYQDFNTPPTMIRVAIHSVAHGYSQILPFDLATSVPEGILFQEPDVDGVSLVNTSPANVGYTIA